MSERQHRPGASGGSDTASGPRGLRLAFVARLSDKKLEQKLAPLLALERVAQVDLFRAVPYSGADGGKLRWRRVPSWIGRSAVLSNLWRLAQLLWGARRYDALVGCHQAYHGLLAWLAGGLWRRPVIQLVISEVSWVAARPLLRRAMLTAAGCSVRGPVNEVELRALGYARPIEHAANPMADPGACPPSSGPRLLVGIGTLIPLKRWDALLRALAAIDDPPLLVIAGEGGERTRLERLAAELGIADRVELPGWLEPEPLAELFARGCALVHPSSSEGMPQVVIEALARARPVIACAVGELPGVLDERCGWLLPSGEPTELERALRELLALDDAALAARQAAARARYLELAPSFEPAAISARYDALLAAALGPESP